MHNILCFKAHSLFWFIDKTHIRQKNWHKKNKNGGFLSFIKLCNISYFEFNQPEFNCLDYYYYCGHIGLIIIQKYGTKWIKQR